MQISRHYRIFISVIAFLVFAVVAPVAATSGFSDVEDDVYYFDAVNWMAKEGITTGIEPGCFGPDERISRGQTAAFFFRLDASQGNNPRSAWHPFTDITATYQQGPVGWLYASGITTGTSTTTFAPGAPISRGDFAVMLWRYAGRPNPRTGHSFIDVHRGYQQSAISWMAEADITTGTGLVTFSPDDTMTRAQAATFIFRFVAPGEPTMASDATSTDVCARDLRVALETGGLTPTEARCVAPYLAGFDIDVLIKVVADEARASITLLIAVAESLRAGCLSNTRIAELTRLFL
ncbi:MAG: hypothetical protein GWP48_09355 [Actinobacteria bacterium]|jgi:hypothetical protein|nr:hypothetical protein [Actinomycetota bacterium]